MHSKPAPTTWSRPNAATPATGYLGAGYAIPTDGGQAALHLLAESEAILTDPVYSAKALHAVSDLARDGREDTAVQTTPHHPTHHRSS